MITQDILSEIAGDIENLLIEAKENINFAYNKIPDELPISIKISIEHTIPPTVKYNISYPLEPARDPIQKQKVTLKKFIGQEEMDL